LLLPLQLQLLPPTAYRPPPAALPNRLSWLRLSFALAKHAVLRPALAVDLLRVSWRFRARGWWHRPPFLPIPDRTYLRWRMHTAYGEYDAIPSAEDVIRYARWSGKRK
jgi:hypothetical protein